MLCRTHQRWYDHVEVVQMSVFGCSEDWSKHIHKKLCGGENGELLKEVRLFSCSLTLHWYYFFNLRAQNVTRSGIPSQQHCELPKIYV